MKILSHREYGDSRTFKLNHRRCQLYGNTTICTRRLLFLYWNIKKCTRRRRGVLPSRLRPITRKSFYFSEAFTCYITRITFGSHLASSYWYVMAFFTASVSTCQIWLLMLVGVWQMSNLTVVTWAWEACVGGPRSSRRRAGPRSRCGRSCSAGPARRVAPPSWRNRVSSVFPFPGSARQWSVCSQCL